MHSRKSFSSKQTAIADHGELQNRKSKIENVKPKIVNGRSVYSARAGTIAKSAHCLVYKVLLTYAPSDWCTD
jgi:hypothetical protein